MKSRRLLATLLAVLALACGRRESATAATRGPIIVISIDTLRSDHLPAYGYTKVATPNVDALRADGVLFANAYSHVPLTLPSHATILTGRLPADTGLRDNAGFRLKETVVTLAELLKKNGYATGAAVSSYALRATSGIGRGFDAYDDRVDSGGANSIGEVSRPGGETEAIAEAWIAAHAKEPFFYLLHLYEPHSPYDPPEPFRSRYTPYDGEIASADAIVGTFVRFLKTNGLYDDATIVLLSDHGEGLGEHGEDEHGILLYRETLQVPLLLKLRGARAKGARVETPVGLIDVFPTLAAAAGTAAADLPGVSLASLLDGRPSPPRRLFAETYFPRLHLGWSDLHSVIEGRNHLIAGTRGELFDLAADPAEQHDRAADDRRLFAALQAALEPQRKPIAVTEQVSPEEAKKLAALGYVGSTAAAGAGALPDPRDEIASFRDLRAAWGLLERGKPDDALRLAKTLAAKFPSMVDGWQLQAKAFGALGRTGDAIEAAKRGLAVNPGSDTLMLMIADLSLQRGDAATARQYASLAMHARPAEAHDILARAALTEGNVEQAAAEAQQSAKAAPDTAMAFWTNGRVALSRNDPAGALAAFEQAAAIARKTHTPLPNLEHDRGVALITLGRATEAEAAFREELRLFPGEAFAYRNLLILLITQRRLDESTRLMETLLHEHPSAEAYAAIAGALAGTGNAPGAKRVAAEGLQRYPGDAALRAIRAR